jgi:hypothetical protein
VVKFLNHIATYLQKPDYTIIPSDLFPKQRNTPPPPRSNPPPEIVSLVFDAAKGANCSVAEAWDMPIGQAYIAQAIRMGEVGANLDFMDEDEREFQASVAAKLSANGKR